MDVNGAPELLCFPHSSEYLPLFWAEQIHAYRFGTTWGWVNDDRIFIFAWTIPLILLLFVYVCFPITGRMHSLQSTTRTCSICGTGVSTIWPLELGNCSSASIPSFACLRSRKCGRRPVVNKRWKRTIFVAMENEQVVSRWSVSRDTLP